jgi:glycosyltransferase involved in cell wall biosynthesis
MSADDRTVFVPFVHSLTELLGLIKLSRLFVLPSINEGMSMALLEASSIGAPILCSDIPANTSVLPDQALYFHSNDVDDLANKLQWALDHPKEMSELGQRAEAWVKEKYSWDLIAEQYDQLYQQYGDHHEHSLRRS